MSNPKVDSRFEKLTKWRDEMNALRKIALDCGLTEELKWGEACYTKDGRNTVLIHGFKEYCAFLFFNGALMADPESILIQQTENVQAGRQIRFTDLRQILDREATLKDYIEEAVRVEKSGVKLVKKKTEDFPVCEELRVKFEQDPAFHEAFKALTPGRQRAYLIHFAQPKQAKTREARIEKFLPRIFDGMGPLD